MQTRDESQTEFKELFKANKGIGIGLLCTSYGKTKCALDLCEDLNSKRSAPAHITVVVPFQVLKDQWEKLVAKRKIPNLKVHIINSYVKLDKVVTDFLIIDEIQSCSNEESEFFKKAIDITEYKYFLGLSGTLEDKHKAFLAERNIPIIKEITREEATTNGWVSNYSIYTLMCKMNEEDTNEHLNLKKKIRQGFSYFQGRDIFPIILKCISDKEFRKQMASQRNIEEGKLFVICKQVLEAIQRRKTILQDCDTKKEIILDIVEKLQMKTIIFGQSTEFSDKVVDLINDKLKDELFISIHSKKGKKENTEALRKLADNRYKLRGASSAKALSTGLNIPDLQLGIMASYTSSSTNYNQQVGRFTRLFKDKKAIIINLCVEGSQEEIWLEKNTGLKNSSIVYSVDEILELEGLIENNIELG